ncbi:MAG: hypothetical protein GEU90_09250 [Gemmatimonas sp.]|nr:hypothetical protein [Gemmatimonas sp.]
MTRCARRIDRSRPILVAGVGSIGSRHVRNLRALGYDNLVVYRTGRGTLDVELDLPPVSTLEEGLARQPLAVVVSNPTALHIPTALAAAETGAHLLIEKPLSHTLDGLELLRRSATERELTVLVGYHLRFHPTLREVRAWIAEGRIGTVVSAIARWGEFLPNWHPWEDHRVSYAAVPSLGGGVIHTLSHPLDYLSWLLGPVQGVLAMVGNRSELGIRCEDVAHLTMRMASGAIATVLLDYTRSPGVHSLEVVGSQGMIEWEMTYGTAVLTERNAVRTEVTIPGAAPPFERNSLFLEEMRHFLSCIEGSETPACTLDDGIAAVHTAVAAHQSAYRGEIVLVDKAVEPCEENRSSLQSSHLPILESAMNGRSSSGGTKHG